MATHNDEHGNNDERDADGLSANATARKDAADHANAESPDANTEPSKSARKREAAARRDLGEALTRLDPGQLDTIPLPANVRAAVDEHQRIRSHGAAKRQLQYLGRLLRETEIEAIATAVANLDRAGADARAAHHRLEHWRERLLTDPAALTDYLDQHPHTDRQALRTLLLRVRRAAEGSTNHKTLVRELFRFIRDNQAA
ncbi:MAG: ribosome biogenesis factor YjgA [Pseudomonadota bacterium]